MIKTRYSTPFIVALALLVNACASSPSYQYFVLTSVSQAATESSEISVGISPVAIPEYLARNEVVFRRDGNRVQLAGTARWAEPLADGMQRVLALELAAQLGTQQVSLLPGLSSAPPAYAVKVNVIALDVTAKQAQLTAEWVITRPAEGELLARHTDQQSWPMPADSAEPDTVARAYSELIGQLSAEIALKISALTEMARAQTP